MGDMSEVMNNAKQIGQTTAPQWEYYPAYSLAELADVLREVEK